MFFFFLLILFSCFSQNFSQALESNYNHSTIKIVPDQILLSDDNYFYFGILVAPVSSSMILPSLNFQQHIKASLFPSSA